MALKPPLTALRLLFHIMQGRAVYGAALDDCDNGLAV